MGSVQDLMTTTRSHRRCRVSIEGIVADPGQAKRVSRKEAVPVVDKQRGKFVVSVALPVGIRMKPVLNIGRGRVVGLASL